MPTIDRGELWDALGDKEYREVESYITELWGYADRQAAVLQVVCEKDNE